MTAAQRQAAEHQLATALEEGDDAAAHAACEAIDQLPPAPPPSLLGAALWYAEQGLHVFPLQPRTKVPWEGTHGCKDATTDTDRIRRWWTSGPGFAESNIGLATGHLVDVIDFDGVEAHTSWGRSVRIPGNEVGVLECAPCGRSWDVAWLGTTCRTCGAEGHPPPPLPDPEVFTLATVSTPRSGGLHIYVPATGAGNRAGLVPHVDYRGLGGYVVAPPSVLDDRPGQVPGVYRFLRPLHPEELV